MFRYPGGSAFETKPKCLFAGVNYTSKFLISLPSQCAIACPEVAGNFGWLREAVALIFIPSYQTPGKGSGEIGIR